MNLRHAAALALVGWYLMVPPFSSDRIGVDPDAPLAKWIITSPHDTATDCNMMQVTLVKIANNRFAANPSRANKISVNQIVSSQCVATDDPRLKEK